MKPSAPFYRAKRDSRQEQRSQAPPRRLSSPLSHALWELSSDIKAKQIAAYDEIERLHAKSDQLTDKILVMERCRQLVTEPMLVGDTGAL